MTPDLKTVAKESALFQLNTLKRLDKMEKRSEEVDAARVEGFNLHEHKIQALTKHQDELQAAVESIVDTLLKEELKPKKPWWKVWN